jgi:hypothetical protein
MPLHFTWQNAFIAALVLSTSMGNFGCDVEIVYIDPPITLVKSEEPVPVGPAALEVGFYFDNNYVGFTDGAPLPVIHGLQGGTWTMPAVRASGMGTYGELTCSLTTASGERVGFVIAKTKFYFNATGQLEVANFPIPVFHPDQPAHTIDDLYGLEATLSCTLFNDSGNTAFQVTVQIIEG